METQDVRVDVGTTSGGQGFIRLTHKPTGKTVEFTGSPARIADPKITNGLLTCLKGQVYAEENRRKIAAAG